MEKQESKFYQISQEFSEWVNAILGQRKFAEVKIAMSLIEKPVLAEAELNHVLSEMGKHSYNEVFRFFVDLQKLIQPVDAEGKPVEVEVEGDKEEDKEVEDDKNETEKS